MVQTWEEAQEFESKWHGTAVNSLNEELKQLVYARKMGIRFTNDGKTPYNIDLHGQSVIDVGGGAYSLLLKAMNFSRAVVAEPLTHPDWILARYKAHNVEYWNVPGEELPTNEKFDLCLIYNVLQHTKDPEKIIRNAYVMATEIRIFEWVNHPISPGHIHTLIPEKLNEWLGGEGKVETVNEQGCHGECFYGIFKGKTFKENRIQERVRSLE